MNTQQIHELTMLKGYKVDFDNDEGFVLITRSNGYGEISVSEIIEKCPSLATIPNGYIWRDKRNNQVVIG